MCTEARCYHWSLPAIIFVIFDMHLRWMKNVSSFSQNTYMAGELIPPTTIMSRKCGSLVATRMCQFVVFATIRSLALMSFLYSGGGNRLNPKLQSGEIPLLWMRAEASLKGLLLKPSVVMWKIEYLNKPITPLDWWWWPLEIFPFRRLCYNNTSKTTLR